MDNTTVGPTEGPALDGGTHDGNVKIETTTSKRARKCTDIYCLALFLFCNACLWTLSGWSYQDGDLFRLERGWDMYGNFCGQGDLRNRTYTFFPVPLQSIDITICLPGCPASVAEEAVCLYDADLQEMSDFGCMNSYPSKPFFNGYCLPADRPQRTKVLTWLYSQDQVMTRVVGDFARVKHMQGWNILAVSGVIAGGAMLLYILTFKVKGTGYLALRLPIYAVSIPVLLFLLAALCFLIYEESWRVEGKLCDHLYTVVMQDCDEGDTANGYRDLCWVLVAISAVVVLGLVCLLPQSLGGIEYLEVASSARRWHPLAHLCPLIGLILGVAFYTYFITLMLYEVSTGEYEDKSVPYLPQGEVRRWSFSTAERVLVFFSVGMVLWWLSFLAHCVEHISASLAILGFFTPEEKVLSQLRMTLADLGKYHLGSVLLASVFLPLGRFPRNVGTGLKTLLAFCFSEDHKFAKCVLCGLTKWLKYMTSTGIALQTFLGGTLLDSAKKGSHLLKRHSDRSPEKSLNQGDRLIWLSQLVITLIGPVFTAYWIQHKNQTFSDRSTKEITSVTAMAIYALVLTWFLAQLYGCFLRGLMYGSTVAYLIKEDSRPRSANNGDVEYPSKIADDFFLNKDQKNGEPVKREAEKEPMKPENADFVPPPSPKHETEDVSQLDEGRVQQPVNGSAATQWFQS